MNAFEWMREETKGWRGWEAGWLVFCLAATGGLSWWWGDHAAGWIAALTGVMYTVLAGKGKRSCYLFGLVNAPLYAWLAWKAQYYGDMALNLYYFAMMIPGWIAWGRHEQSGGKGIEKTRLGGWARVAWTAGILAAVAAGWAILWRAGGARPLCDSATNVLSIAAMILTVKRCVEQWWMWVAVDGIEVWMWWRRWAEAGNDASLLAMWILFLANGFVLWGIWLRDLREADAGRRA